MGGRTGINLLRAGNTHGTYVGVYYNRIRGGEERRGERRRLEVDLESVLVELRLARTDGFPDQSLDDD
jgi:hypothetical protein